MRGLYICDVGSRMNVAAFTVAVFRFAHEISAERWEAWIERELDELILGALLLRVFVVEVSLFSHV